LIAIEARKYCVCQQHILRPSRRAVDGSSQFTITHSSKSHPNAVSQLCYVPSRDNPVVDDKRRRAAIQIVLVVVGTVAVVVHEADLGAYGDHVRGSSAVLGRVCEGGGKGEEWSTDVVNSQFEDCAWSNDDF